MDNVALRRTMFAASLADEPKIRQNTIGEPPVFLSVCKWFGGGVQLCNPDPFSTCNVCFLSVVCTPRIVERGTLPENWRTSADWEQCVASGALVVFDAEAAEQCGWQVLRVEDF